MRGGDETYKCGIEREKHESIREHGTCTPWRGEDEMLYYIIYPLTSRGPVSGL